MALTTGPYGVSTLITSFDFSDGKSELVQHELELNGEIAKTVQRPPGLTVVKQVENEWL